MRDASHWLVLLCICLSVRAFSQSLPTAVVADSLFNTIDGAYEANEFDNALSVCHQALHVFADSVSTPTLLSARLYRELGKGHFYTGQVDSCIQYWQLTYDIYQQLLDSDAYERAMAATNLGIALDEKGYYQKAIDLYQEALPILRREKGPDSPTVGVVYTNLAVAYVNLGDYMHALEFFERAKDIDFVHFGAQSVEVADDLVNLGALHGDIDQHKKAIQYFEQALEVLYELFGDNHFKVAEVYGNLGVRYKSLKKYDKALRFYRMQLKIYESEKSYHTYVIKVLNNIGNCYRAMQDYHLALQYFINARDKYFSYGYSDAIISLVLSNLALVYEDLSEYNNAVIINHQILERERNAIERVGSEDKLSVLKSLVGLGRAYYNLTLDNHDSVLADSSVYYFEKSLELMDDILIDYRNNGSKQIFIQNYYDSYSYLIDLYYRKADTHHAFVVSEKSKSYLLRNALRGISVKYFIDLPIDIIEERDRLKKQAQESFLSLDQSNLESREDYFKKKRSYEAYIEKLEAMYPEYVRFINETKVPTISYVSDSLLHVDQSFIEYYYSGKDLYISIIDTDSASIHKLILTEDLA
ncbi:MAG: tetratricopeptide repeat protein, partial [Bacteroidota bacterium]